MVGIKATSLQSPLLKEDSVFTWDEQSLEDEREVKCDHSLGTCKSAVSDPSGRTGGNLVTFEGFGAECEQEEDAAARRPRLLDRDGKCHQSRGTWNIRHSNHHLSRYNRATFYLFHDWFHALLYSPTRRVFFFLFSCYALTVVLFGLSYFGAAVLGSYLGDGKEIGEFCNMGVMKPIEAIYFSLSTMTTIGYGANDYYFGDCWAPFVLVMLQVFAAIAFDAIAIGLIFQRISRGVKRGKTVIFSNKAIIRRVNGKLYFIFRVGELVQRHLVECHIRLYCLRHRRSTVVRKRHDFISFGNNVEHRTSGDSPHIETAYFQSYNMKIDPSDNLMGSYLLTTLPNLVVHQIDKTSPLMPPRVWYDGREAKHEWHGCTQRAAGDGRQWSLEADEREQREITDYLVDREAEVAVVLEGVDEMTSSIVQVKHSYSFTTTFPEPEIAWNAMFTPCVARALPFPVKGKSNRRSALEKLFNLASPKNEQMQVACTVDFDKFHCLTSAPSDCDDSSFCR